MKYFTKLEKKMQQYYGDTPHIIPKKRKKVKVRSNFFRKFVNLICFAVVIFCIYSLFYALIYYPSKSESFTKINNRMWFFVTLDNKTTEEIKQNGGGGIVIQDHKVVSVYATENDAKVVANRIDGEVYNFSISEINLKKEEENLIRPLDFYVIAYADVTKIIEEWTLGAPVGAVSYALGSLKNECSSLKSSITDNSEFSSEVLNYLSKIETKIERTIENIRVNNLSILWELCCEIVYDRAEVSEKLAPKNS